MARYAALHSQPICPTGTERNGQVFDRLTGLSAAAGVQINRCIAMFGPRVNRQMGLGDEQQSGDTLRLKLMKLRMQDDAACGFGSLAHGLVDLCGVVENLCIAPVQVCEQMGSKCLHGVADTTRPAGVE